MQSNHSSADSYGSKLDVEAITLLPLPKSAIAPSTFPIPQLSISNPKKIIIMPASTRINKLSPLSFGLSLLSAIALSLPQSVQAQSLTLNQQQPLNTPEVTPISSNNGIALDRTIPISELPPEVARLALESVAQTSGLAVSNLQIASVRYIAWSDGCRGVYRPGFMCSMALVDDWIVTVGSGEQNWVYQNGSAALVANEPGSSQQNPIMPNVTLPNRWEFTDVPRRTWSDPPTAYGFRYEMTSDSVFTQILDFPTGFTKPFTVLVKDVILGKFTAGNSVNFSNYSTLLGNLLVGNGVKEFSVTGLNVDPSNPAVFPIKLDFNTETANFNMHALLNEESQPVPEPSEITGIVTSAAFFGGLLLKRKRKSEVAIANDV
ncbi:MAG TPA: PEP-CTERM sorting domain-containing protein [Kamptonema sp.]|nr:PEP-CTERM sorting domain-containing protein [Kamptonema sp.]